MNRILLIAFALFISVSSNAQTKTSENVIIVTMDGLRWQEVFGGADSVLTFDTAANYSTRYVKSRFWKDTKEERRKTLMPFLWSEVATKGIVLGNQELGNRFENANPYWFSYPGYNEIFTGYPDTGVNSNDKIPNPNVTVLEFLNKQPAFKNKIAVFGSWDVFASIFNEGRSGLLVNDGFRDLKGKLNDKQKFYNALQHQVPDLFHGGERLDVATFYMGFEYLKANQPRVMYFAFGDTDEFAHAGDYDYYLDAAQNADAFIRLIWEYVQSTPKYANKTTLILATDHGRGDARDSQWRHHGSKIVGANQLWMAAMGPSIPATGEAKTQATNQQGQIAATIAKILGQDYKPSHKPLPALSW